MNVQQYINSKLMLTPSIWIEANLLQNKETVHTISTEGTSFLNELFATPISYEELNIKTKSSKRGRVLDSKTMEVNHQPKAKEEKIMQNDPIKDLEQRIETKYRIRELEKDNEVLQRRIEELEGKLEKYKSKSKGLSGVELEKNELLKKIEKQEEELEKNDTRLKTMLEAIKIYAKNFFDENPQIVSQLFGGITRGLTGMPPQKAIPQENLRPEQYNNSPTPNENDTLKERVLDKVSNLSKEDLEKLNNTIANKNPNNHVNEHIN